MFKCVIMTITVWVAFQIAGMQFEMEWIPEAYRQLIFLAVVFFLGLLFGVPGIRWNRLPSQTDRFNQDRLEDHHDLPRN